MTAFATFHCSLFSIGDDEESLSISYLKYEDVFFDTTTCWAWEDALKEEFFDTTWKLGKAASITSFSLGFLAFIVSTVANCTTIPRVILNILGGVYILCAFCSAGMLSGLSSPGMCGSEDDGLVCKLAYSAYMAIAAAVLFLVAGIVTKNLRKKLHMLDGNPSVIPVTVADAVASVGDQNVTKIEEVIHPDGSRQVTETKEVVKPDGSREVTVKTTEYAGRSSDSVRTPPGLTLHTSDDDTASDSEGVHPMEYDMNDFDIEIDSENVE